MESKNRVKSGIIYFVGIILILFMICAVIIFYKKYKEESVLKKVSYNSIDNSTFEVYYSGSNVASGKSKEEGFIRKYTDHIDLNFNYTLNFSDTVSGTQESLVKATLIVYAPNSETKIWESDVDYVVPSKKTEYENTSQYRFNYKVSIDYKKYLELYEYFKNETSVVSNAKISVEFISSSIANAKDVPKMFQTDMITYDIPLSDVTFTINKNTNIKNEEKSVKKVMQNEDKQIYLYLTIAGIFLIIAPMCLIIIRYLDDRKKNGYYKNKLNKILKSYDNIIVNVESIPSLNGKEIIEVTTFEELLDAQMEMRVPINYCETIKNYESEFIIITNDMAWIYILKKERR